MKQLTILIILIIFTSGLKAQKTLTEEDFIQVMRNYHPVAKQAALDVRIAEANVTSSRGAFDPTIGFDRSQKELEGNLYYNHRITEIKIPTWYGVDFFAGTETVTGDRASSELTQGSLTYVGFSIPVARNLLMDSRRAALQQAKLFQQESEMHRRIILNELFRNGLRTYWEWWEHFHVYRLVENSLQVAEKRFEMVKTTYRLGERPAIDTLEALTQVQFLQQKLTETTIDLIKARLELSLYLWRENNEPYELPADVNPQASDEADNILLDSVLQVSRNHPELTQYIFKIDALQIERQLRFQSLLPVIDLKYNQIGKGTDFSKTVNAAWFQNNYRFGISMYMPLRLSAGRGEFQKVKFRMEQTKLEQINKSVQISNKVKQFYTEWQQTGRQVELQRNMVVNFSQLQRGEEIRFMNGESSLFLINARESRTLESQEKLFELRAKSRKAYVDLRWSAGTL